MGQLCSPLRLLHKARVKAPDVRQQGPGAGALVLCGAIWLAGSLRQRKEVHPVTTEKEAELERTTRLRGFRYGLHDFLAALDLHALKAVNDHVEADYVNESLLDRRTKEFLILVAC